MVVSCVPFVNDSYSFSSIRQNGAVILKTHSPQAPMSITKVTHFIFKIFSRTLLPASTAPSPVQAPVIAHLEHSAMTDLH